jgi:hypothetical protein
MARNSISVNKDTMGVANEVSENELPSPATSKRAWYPWVVDPVATENLCADTTSLIEYKEYQAWERKYHSFATAEGFYYALGYGRVSLALKNNRNSTTVLTSRCYYSPMGHNVFSLWRASQDFHIGFDQSKGTLYYRSQPEHIVGLTDRVGDHSEIRLEQIPSAKLISAARTISPEPNIAFLMLCVLLFLHYFRLA